MDRLLRELNEVKNCQKKKSEEQRVTFEKRIEAKLQDLNRFRGQEQSGPSGNSQNRENRFNHRGQDQCGSSSTPAREHDPFPADDFLDFDVDYPINRDAGIEELEWNIRTDLEFKFRLVN